MRSTQAECIVRLKEALQLQRLDELRYALKKASEALLDEEKCEEFKEAGKDFIDAFEEAWDDADDEARARAKRAIDEMLDLEVEFTRLLEV